MILNFIKGMAMAERTVTQCLPMPEIREAGKKFHAIGRFFENTLQPKLDLL